VNFLKPHAASDANTDVVVTFIGRNITYRVLHRVNLVAGVFVCNLVA
jgi:hypothetical protein